MTNLDENTVYIARLTVESVGDSDHFRVKVEYDPPISELKLTNDEDTVPTAFGVVSNLIPVLLGQHEIALADPDDVREDQGLEAAEGGNVVELFGPTNSTVQ